MRPSLLIVRLWLLLSLRKLTAKWGLYSHAISMGVFSVNYFIFHSPLAELTLISGPNFTVAPGYEYAYSLGTCVVGFINLFTTGPNESFCDFLMVNHTLLVNFLG
jgi:hypothetical protein